MKIEIKNEWFKKKYEPKFKKLPKKICEEEKKSVDLQKNN